MPPLTSRRSVDYIAPDADLVERAQRGDRSAFAELYTRHAPAVTRLARARTGSSEVEDAVAETFVRAWKFIGRYKFTGKPFVAWLYGISRNVIKDGHRKASHVTTALDVDMMAVADASRGPDAMADLVDLGRAMRRLNTRQRKVIELKYLAGLSNEEVGVALGIAPGAVNTLQWRALRKLETIMGVDS